MNNRQITSILIAFSIFLTLVGCNIKQPTETVVTNPSSSANPTTQSVMIPQPTIQITPESDKTTLPPDPDMQCPLITFSLDPNELTNEYMARLILEAEYLLTEYGTFRLNNYYGAEYYIKRTMKYMDSFPWYTPLDESVTLLVGPYRTENFSTAKVNEMGIIYWHDFFEEDPGYITIKASDHPVRRYFQRFLVVMVMLYEKYADCLIDFDYYFCKKYGPHGAPNFRNAIYVSTDFRDSEYDTMADFMTNILNESVNVENGFHIRYYASTYINLDGKNRMDYYGKDDIDLEESNYYNQVLKSLSLPTKDDLID